MTADRSDADLRAALERLVAAQSSPAQSDPVDAIRERVRSRRRGRRVRSAGAVGLAVAAALVAAVVVRATLLADPDTPVGIATTPTTGQPTSTTGGPPAGAPGSGIEVVDSVPLEPRGDVALAVIGTEVVIWGGDLEGFNMGVPGQPDQVYADGAAYDVTAGTWRAMSTSPLPANGISPVAVAVRDGVVIARGSDVALWDPKTDTWRELIDAPGPVEDLTAIGDESLVSVSANARLDLATGEWSLLPDPPERLARVEVEAVWTGEVLIAFGWRSGAASPVPSLSYDPRRNTWESVDSPPDLVSNAVAAAPFGSDVVVMDYQMRAAVLDPTSMTWRKFPYVPARFYEDGPQIIATSDGMIALTGTTISVFGLSGGSTFWAPVPKPATVGRRAVEVEISNHEDAVVIFAFTDGRNALVLLTPGLLATDPREIVVGTADVQLPEGLNLVGSGNDVSNVTAVITAELDGPSGACEISSVYIGIGGVDGSTPWEESDGGGTWTRTVGSDVTTVRCDEPTTGRALVDGITFGSNTGREER